MSEHLTLEQSMAEANRILSEAGWHPHPEWEGAFARNNLVGGIQPDKQGCHFKDWTRIPPGHPLHSADTPDEPHEAAEWLVRLAAPGRRVALAPVDPVVEPVEPIPAAAEPLDAPAVTDSDGDWDTVTPESEDVILDVLAGERPLALSFESEMAEAEEQEEAARAGQKPDYSGPTFIGLDDLDHKRALAGYRVRQIAKARKPFWTTDHDAALSELRNFAMGVSEGRWLNDDARQNELTELEATLSRIREIEAACDAKLSFIDAATREQVEAFDPEADWPE